MKQLWAPWRMHYIRSPKIRGCLFCRSFQARKSRSNLVILKTSDCLCMLNRYPYNNGHLMVVPASHCGRLSDLPDHEVVAMMKMTQRMERLLGRTMRPEGYNLGVNLGKTSGAGIENHLHLHIVPRWNGDTNFMPVLGDVRVIPQALEDLYDYLSEALAQEEKR